MFLAEKNIYFQVFKIQKLGPYFFLSTKVIKNSYSEKLVHNPSMLRLDTLGLPLLFFNFLLCLKLKPYLDK
jgi:hypothetical protein